MFQIIDVVDMMQPVTKWTRQIMSGETLPARVREAFRLAAEERPGATHLELPEDIAAEEVTGAPLEPSSVRRPVVEDRSVDAALELLRGAKRPLIVIGAGANRKLTASQLLEFVEKQGIPFITTQMGKGVIDERHPKFLGNAALSSGDYVHAALSHADLILNVGHDIVEKPPFIMERDHSRTVIHIDFSSAEVDPLYFPQVEMVGDVAHSIWRLNEALEPSAEWSFEPMFKARSAMLEEQEAAAGGSEFPLRPQRLVADVRGALPDDGIIALDNGIYKLWFARNYAAHRPNTVLLDNALATMGAGLPSAMAAKMVHPERKVVAICGDGGFLMNSQELETATRLGLDLVVLVLNDGALGMIKWKQEDMGFRDYGLDYGNPSFPKYAESYGAHGHRLEASQELAALLERCFKAGGVHLIDVPVDYSQNDELLHEQIPRLASAFAMPDGATS